MCLCMFVCWLVFCHYAPVLQTSNIHEDETSRSYLYASLLDSTCSVSNRHGPTFNEHSFGLAVYFDMQESFCVAFSTDIWWPDAVEVINLLLYCSGRSSGQNLKCTPIIFPENCPDSGSRWRPRDGSIHLWDILLSWLYSGRSWSHNAYI